MQDLVIDLQQLKFSWSGNKELVLDIDSIQVPRARHLFIQGASGSGKTSLLNLITGINQPVSGDIKVLGQDFSTLTGTRRDRFRADHLGVIFQQFNLLPYLSILDNVMLPCRFSRRRREKAGDVEQAALSMLSDLQIPDKFVHRSVMDLSVGQQQRVAVARALIGHPEIVLADEPTSALDRANRDSFIEMLFSQAKAHQTTLIFVSHDETLSDRFPDKINLTEINQAQRVIQA